MSITGGRDHHFQRNRAIGQKTLSGRRISRGGQEGQRLRAAGQDPPVPRVPAIPPKVCLAQTPRFEIRRAAEPAGFASPYENGRRRALQGGCRPGQAHERREGIFRGLRGFENRSNRQETAD